MCKRCGRTVLMGAKGRRGAVRCAVRAVVVHSFYGCDSLCCGHTIYGYDCNGRQVYSEFEFTHPYGADHKAWATSLADEHLRGADLDWDECEISDD